MRIVDRQSKFMYRCPVHDAVFYAETALVTNPRGPECPDIRLCMAGSPHNACGMEVATWS